MTSRKAKPKTIPAVRPNEGVRIAYQRRIERLITQMERSTLYWVGASYRANEPEIAQDASPARELRGTVRGLARRWQRKFDAAAAELAAYFAQEAAGRSDAALRSILKRAGIAVEFRATRAVNDILQATIAENVALIKSLPAQYMVQVEGHVMRSVQLGRDLSTLAKSIEHQGGVTKRRAAFIARDQNNKATAAIHKARQEELGIEEAIWLHSAGGKKPRPEHVAFSGQRYNVKKGAFLEGKWTWPGVEPNCRCVSRSVVPGF